MDTERRAVPRYPFTAHAELSDANPSTRFNVRISDLSTKGRYVDMIHPLPEGTAISLNIPDRGGYIEVKRRIIYSVPQHGAGVPFLGLTPELTAQLERTLNLATSLAPT
jgi:hypothetical protein